MIISSVSSSHMEYSHGVGKSQKRKESPIKPFEKEEEENMFNSNVSKSNYIIHFLLKIKNIHKNSQTNFYALNLNVLDSTSLEHYLDKSKQDGIVHT